MSGIGELLWRNTPIDKWEVQSMISQDFILFLLQTGYHNMEAILIRKEPERREINEWHQCRSVRISSVRVCDRDNAMMQQEVTSGNVELGANASSSIDL